MTETARLAAALAAFASFPSVDAALLIPAWGTALLHFLWQGALIGLCAALALALLREARPQTRYAVACAALCLCLMAPTLSFWRALHVTASGVAQAPSAIAMESARYAAMPAAEGVVAPTWPDTALPWVVGFWAFGAALMLLRIAAGMLWLQRLHGRARLPALADWQRRLDRLARRFGLRSVPLAVADDDAGPLTIGFLRPVILVPAALLARMPAEWVEALLAHELAHIRRHDYLVNLLQRAIEALLFYHPTVWWLSRRIANERELIADRLAAEALGDARRLALALAELDRFPLAPSTLAQTAHGGQLMSRIQSLLRPGRTQAGGGILLPLTGLAVTAVAFYVYADSRPATSVAPAQQAVVAPAEPAVESEPTAKSAERPTGTLHPARAADAAMAAQAAAERAAATATHDALAAERNAAIAKRDAAAAERNAAEAARNAIAAEHNAAEAARGRAGAAQRVVRRSGDRSYALVSADSDAVSMSGDLAEIEAIRAAKRRFGGDFLWFRHDDKAYVMRDPELLSRARRELATVSVHDMKMEALAAEMQRHGRRMEAIGQRMEAVSLEARETAAMHEAANRLEALAGQHGAYAARIAELRAREMSAAQARTREREVEAIAREMAATQRAMQQQQALIEAQTARIEADTRPLKALEKEMEAASKPMEALDRKMRTLAAAQQHAAADADKKIQALAEEAVRTGKAIPAEPSP